MEKSHINKDLFRTTCTPTDSVVSGTKSVFVFFTLVCHDSVLQISFQPVCVCVFFQYTTGVMFVFIVLSMIVMILSAVPLL